MNLKFLIHVPVDDGSDLSIALVFRYAEDTHSKYRLWCSQVQDA